MSYAAGVFLLIVAMAIITGAMLQLSQYHRGHLLITKRQLILRLITAGLLLFIIGMIFFGVLYNWPSALSELGFWSILMLLAIVVIFLAFNDLRLVERERHLKQAELYRNVAKIQDISQKNKDKQDTDAR